MSSIVLALLLASPASSAADRAEPSEPSSRSPLPEVDVPFGCGLAFPVSQAHQTGSHQNNDTWAWDFRMPEGVPITAAKDGVVRMARGDSTVGGCDARFARYANYVVVAHEDGLETQYLHFKSVVVKPGDRVKQGDLLGYSGKTGWACGAHLHFKVARRVGNGWNNPSVPAHIRGYGDPKVATLLRAPACRKAPEVQLADGQAPASSKPALGGTAGATAPASVPGEGARTGSGAQVVPVSAQGREEVTAASRSPE